MLKFRKFLCMYIYLFDVHKCTLMRLGTLLCPFPSLHCIHLEIDRYLFSVLTLSFIHVSSAINITTPIFPSITRIPHSTSPCVPKKHTLCPTMGIPYVLHYLTMSYVLPHGIQLYALCPLIQASVLSVVDQHGTERLVAGSYTVEIGTNDDCSSSVTTTLQVTGEDRILFRFS